MWKNKKPKKKKKIAVKQLNKSIKKRTESFIKCEYPFTNFSFN